MRYFKLIISITGLFLFIVSVLFVMPLLWMLFSMEVLGIPYMKRVNDSVKILLSKCFDFILDIPLGIDFYNENDDSEIR